MKLYEINIEIEKLFESIDETGEISPEIEQSLDLVSADKTKKVLDIVAYMKGLKAEENAIKEESAKLQKRAKTINNKYESILNYLKNNISEGEKYKDEKSSISWRKSSKVVIDDMTAIDEKYITYDPIISKESIKIDLKNGPVKGAHIEECLNMQIS